MDALYQRLNRYHFVLVGHFCVFRIRFDSALQVRGTPASGKSTLAELLAEHIKAKEPKPNLVVVPAWSHEGNRNLSGERYLTENYRYDPAGRNIVIIDEAQLTYWDTALWNSVLKPITPESPNRFILFASYGSPNRRPSVEGTPMLIQSPQHISLRPIEHGDGIPSAGLLLSTDEFNDMIQQRYPVERFTQDFLNYVHEATAGQTGAVKDFLDVVLAHDVSFRLYVRITSTLIIIESYRDIKRSYAAYSLETFRTQFPIRILWENLNGRSIFRRGLPLIPELQDLDVAGVFRSVLTNQYVASKFLDAPGKVALQRCIKRGWLHAPPQDDRSEEEVEHTFTTPLHQWFVDYHLGNGTPDPLYLKTTRLNLSSLRS